MTTAVDREARQDVADVLVRYATGIDSRDWALFRSCFTDDCEADYGEIGVWHSADEITEWMRATHEPCGHTLHRITNQAVTGDPLRSPYVEHQKQYCVAPPMVWLPPWPHPTYRHEPMRKLWAELAH